ELPAPVRGNIFRVPDGRVIVTMVTENRSMFADGGVATDLPVVVRFAGSEKVGRATVRSVDYEGADEAALSREGDTLTITVPRHRTASIVILES
ncbi:MAG TPA: hypothetical protein VFJ30_16685, partial [Phycisphaerae bacterium]|nr:hypothetical protein [Phycisphaerae bacterium]